MLLVFVFLHTMHVKVVTPFAVHVGSFVTFPSSQVWLGFFVMVLPYEIFL